MSYSILIFSVISMLIMCIEHASGGTFPTECVSENGLPPKCTGAIAGDWDPIGIIPIFVFSGIPYGIIEMIRRVIPQQICGNDENKLKKFDAIVHVNYEVAGTVGAFFSAYISLINGKAYAAIITPPLYCIAGFFWYFLILPPPLLLTKMPEKFSGGLATFAFELREAFSGFFASLYYGAKIVLLDRRFTWLFFGYTIPLVMHRYIENGVASTFAKLELKESAYASFIVSGSNFGELCGAFFVFFNLQLLVTPLPMVRWDALVLNFTWLYYNAINVESIHADPADIAGVMAAIMCLISAGWAAGDVSMAAYIQSKIPTLRIETNTTNPLAAVMSFLYTSYIVIYAIISPLIGHWQDGYSVRAKRTQDKTLKAAILLAQKVDYFYWIAGVLFSLTSILIFVNTFIPRGSWKLNPEILDGLDDNHTEELSVSAHDDDDDDVEMSRMGGESCDMNDDQVSNKL